MHLCLRLPVRDSLSLTGGQVVRLFERDTLSLSNSLRSLKDFSDPPARFALDTLSTAKSLYSCSTTQNHVPV